LTEKVPVTRGRRVALRQASPVVKSAKGKAKAKATGKPPKVIKARKVTRVESPAEETVADEPPVAGPSAGKSVPLFLRSPTPDALDFEIRPLAERGPVGE
jgi:hypothetical protein